MAALTHTAGEIDADLYPMSHDKDLCNKIMTKRREEMARRSRLMNPRSFKMGCDPNNLDQHVAIQREAAATKHADDAYFAQSSQLQAQVLQACEDVKAQQVKDRDRAAIEYSMQHLKKEQRREYALSDPNHLKNDRVLDYHDPILGPCSMQKWEGDCLDMALKKRDEQANMRGWLDAQAHEKEQRAEREREMDRRFDQEILLANEVRAVCEHAAVEEAREDKREEAAANLQVAQEVMQRRQLRQMREIEAKARHVDTVVNSEMISERVNYKIGSNGKLMKGEYKRLSQEEELEVHMDNARLMYDKQQRLRQDAVEAQEIAQNVQLGVSVLGGIEQERSRQELERRRRMVEHNQAAAIAKKERDAEERRQYMQYDCPPPLSG